MYDFGNNNLGVSYSRVKNNREAKRLFLQAVAINQGYADAHNNLCVIFTIENDFAQAVSHGEAATQIKPDHPGYHINLGGAYEGQNRLQEAANQFMLAIHYDPTSPTAYYRLGLLSSRIGNNKLAEQCFRACTQLDPDNVDSHCFLARYCYNLAVCPRLRTARGALRINPNHAHSRQLWESLRGVK